MWALVFFVAASAGKPWTAEDAAEFRKLHTAFTQMYSKVNNGADGDDIPYDIKLPAGWTYSDVVTKCGRAGHEDEHSAADCMTLMPALLQGYWEEIKSMEEEYRAKNPAPIFPSKGWTPSTSDGTEDGAPSSFLEAGEKSFLEASGKLEMHSRMREDMKALEGVHMMSKAEIKQEAKKVLAEMRAHNGMFADHEHPKHKWNNRYMDPNFVKNQIKSLGQLQTHLNQEYEIRQKRDAPIMEDLKLIQAQQRDVAKQEEKENQEEIEESKSMARTDWERAHSIRPPRMDPGKPGDPDYQTNINKMWHDAEMRAKDEDQHEADEMKRLERIAERHRTPSPSQTLERQLTERLLIDDEKLEGRQPSEQQLEEAGLAKPQKNKLKMDKRDAQLERRLHQGRDDLKDAEGVAQSLRKG